MFLPSLGPARPQKQTNPPMATPEAPVNAAKKSTGKSKAEVLRRYRAKIGKPHLPEEALLRDALYILQGISGKHINLLQGDTAGSDSKLIFNEDPVRDFYYLIRGLYIHFI